MHLAGSPLQGLFVALNCALRGFDDSVQPLDPAVQAIDRAFELFNLSRLPLDRCFQTRDCVLAVFQLMVEPFQGFLVRALAGKKVGDCRVFLEHQLI